LFQFHRSSGIHLKSTKRIEKECYDDTKGKKMWKGKEGRENSVTKGRKVGDEDGASSAPIA